VTIVHRHLDVAVGTPPEELPLDALDDLLDRGDLDDWRPVAAAIRRDPHGSLADRILWLCRSHPMYGTSQLWPEWIARLRGDTATPSAIPLAEMRRLRSRSQAEMAHALGISQSDVSKLERRADVRVSTLRRYVAALGGELRLTARFPAGASSDPAVPSTIELDVGATGAGAVDLSGSRRLPRGLRTSPG
jgi:transcriptional regulator with XRE-family HTH domain